MIIPDDLTLEEYIGVIKAEVVTESTKSSISDRYIRNADKLAMLEIIKSELDKKQNKETE